MSEDITTPATFDLIAAIDGTTRPETVVPFYFDERAAQTVANLEDELKKLVMLSKADEYTKLEDVKEQLIADLKETEYKVTVRGIPRKVKKAIVASAEAKHPDKTSPLGIAEPNPEGVEYLNLLHWQAYIVSIESPDGGVRTGLSEAEVQYLLDEGPEASLRAVGAAIADLESGPKSGYEQIVQDRDFLSKR